MNSRWVHNRHRIFLIAWVGMICCGIGSRLSRAQIVAVATEGKQAVGEPAGIKYSSFGSPVIGPDGTIGFHAVVGTSSTSNPQTQIAYIGTPSLLKVVSQQGTPVVGAPGTVFLTCDVEELGTNGVGTGVSTINGAGITSDAIFGGGVGSWTCYAYQGLTAPGTGGAAYTGFFFLRR